MTHLETIRAAVIKTQPNVMQDVPVPFLNKSQPIRLWQYSYIDKDGINRHSDEFDSKEDAIEGAINSGFFRLRPIRLADVLVAIERSNLLIDIVKADLPEVKVDFYGNLTVTAVDKEEDEYIHASGAKWNLLNDNLEVQSEETLAFLAHLLA